MNNRQSQEKDIMALLRLFQFIREEAKRLGLEETARLVDLPAVACLQEAQAAHGMRIPEIEAVLEHARRESTH